MKVCKIFFMSLVLALAVPQAVSAAEGGTDLKEAAFDASQESVPVVIYAYVADDAENPYNQPNRDITVEFGGNGDYYITAEAYHFLDDTLYKDYGIVRMVCKLPSADAEELFYPTLTASDIPAAESMSYLVALNSDAPVDVTLGSAIPASSLQSSLNEFYFVGSHDHQWVEQNGGEKLTQMYHLLHSEDGNIHNNRLGNADIDEEVFRYWQEEMTNDPTITGWQDEDGTVYTREDMNQLGYSVPEILVNHAELETEIADAVDETLPQTGDTGEGETAGEEAEQSQIPPAVQQERRSGIPPLAIVIVCVVACICAVIIARIRNDRNESDLFIDD